MISSPPSCCSRCRCSLNNLSSFLAFSCPALVPFREIDTKDGTTPSCNTIWLHPSLSLHRIKRQDTAFSCSSGSPVSKTSASPPTRPRVDTISSLPDLVDAMFTKTVRAFSVHLVASDPEGAPMRECRQSTTPDDRRAGMFGGCMERLWRTQRASSLRKLLLLLLDCRSWTSKGTTSVKPLTGLASSRQERSRYRAIASSQLSEFEIICSSNGITPADMSITLFLRQDELIRNGYRQESDPQMRLFLLLLGKNHRVEHRTVDKE
ncbi:hypothetical protein MUK42_16564 [Musa troglodytarum]|uniref:Uncharacterized protein n=1 Tax=Musa troglodytarum TaxID=320322 RepID=A0A9E7L3N3_9LILI|nr:hypothetical protein MUK42_16564 [Musa troglodytarum]